MNFHLYDSLRQQVAPFFSVHPGEIRLYVCGITIYDLCHLGHARVFVVFDTIVRYWRSLGWKVIFVRNITDIDDKILARAAQEGKFFSEVTQTYIEAMDLDMEALGLEKPTIEPRATDAIVDIIQMIQQLCIKGAAYIAENKDVYFSVEACSDYGALSHQHLEQLKTGARIEPSPYKRNPLDFVLWKAAKPGEPYWQAPFGAGRPGWHSECSAMSLAHLGETMDVHGGGHDLQFPHHENERAQSECITGKPFVRHWMHVGFVQMDKEKMSKSLGNIVTIRALLEKYASEVIRFFLLQTHYRSPVHYEESSLQVSKNALDRLYSALKGIDLVDQKADKKIEKTDLELRFDEALANDFNTPLAFSILFELAKEIFIHKEQEEFVEAQQKGGLLKKIGATLGLLQTPPSLYFHNQSVVDVAWIEAQIQARQEARLEKKFKEADAIRNALLQKGILLEDTSFGTEWKSI